MATPPICTPPFPAIFHILSHCPPYYPLLWPPEGPKQLPSLAFLGTQQEKGDTEPKEGLVVCQWRYLRPRTAGPTHHSQVAILGLGDEEL